MLRKNLLNLLLASLLVAGCTAPPDVVMCTELEPDELGWCTFTISEKEFYVDNDANLFLENKKKYTWREIKATSLIVPASSQAKISAYIITNCKKHNDCKNDIGKWSTKLKRVETKAKEKR